MSTVSQQANEKTAQNSDVAKTNPQIDENENQELVDKLQAVEIEKDSESIAFDFLVPRFTENVPRAWNIAKHMLEVDADLKFFNDYVETMRDPDSYKIEVTRAFRINSLHPAHVNFDYLLNHTLLMHGVHGNKLFYYLRDGFNDSNGASSKKMYFGRGFYFTDCSTKAFNFSCHRDSYKFERKADAGECQPDPGNFGYILVCDVALGHRVSSFCQMKCNDIPFTNGDSLTSHSKYQAKQMLKLRLPINIDEGNQTVALPYGGFQLDQGDVKIEYPTMTRFADYCVYDPKQIEMCWLLEVRRIPEYQIH